MEFEGLTKDARAPNAPLIIAGPCAAESRAQVLEVARALAASGQAKFFRAGIWKPRTQPGFFEGVGERGLPWLREVSETLPLRPCVEVAGARHVELVAKNGIDAVWIGARTTGSPFAVQDIADALAGSGMTVFVKNPLNPDLGLWLGALERLSARTHEVHAVHRGFSSASPSSLRYAPMWHLPLELKQRHPELKILCDPSHIAGRAELVQTIAQTALDLDLDGLMVEVHNSPSAAQSDAQQQLTPVEFEAMLAHLVYHDPKRPEPGAEREVAALRHDLDDVDSEILAALKKRWDIVRRIGDSKQNRGMTHFQLQRMNEVLARWRSACLAMDLPPELGDAVYRAIHDASLNEQVNALRTDQPTTPEDT